MSMYPVGHNFHPFLYQFENRIQKLLRNDKEKVLFELAIFKLKCELFRAEAEKKNFLLPTLASQDTLALYMIPHYKEVDFSTQMIKLKSTEPLMREIEIISTIVAYCKDGDMAYNANLSQVLCSTQTNYSQKLKLLKMSDLEN